MQRWEGVHIHHGAMVGLVGVLCHTFPVAAPCCMLCVTFSCVLQGLFYVNACVSCKTRCVRWLVLVLLAHMAWTLSTVNCVHCMAHTLVCPFHALPGLRLTNITDA